MQNKQSFKTLNAGKSDPEISILMPIWNCEKFVQQAIESTLNQQEVTAEIIISDDASTDQTSSVALRTISNWLEKNVCQHKILFRQGNTRLRRVHFQLLRDVASCDVVFEAHGDDIQHPFRAKVVLEIFSQDNFDACLVYVDSNIINEDYATKKKNLTRPDNLEVRLIDITFFLIEDIALIGAAMAWRTSKISHFSDVSSLSPVAHDRIRGFRGALSGPCYFVAFPLYDRRLHTNNMHLKDINEPPETENAFGKNLIRLSFFNAMRHDLEFAHQINLIDQEKFLKLEKLILVNIKFCTKLLVTAFKSISDLGYELSWKKII